MRLRAGPPPAEGAPSTCRASPPTTVPTARSVRRAAQPRRACTAARPPGTGISTLTEVLDLAAVHGAHVATEVKPEAGGPDAERTARCLAALLADRRRRRPGADRVTTTSFDLATAASLAGCGSVSGALIVASEVDPHRAALCARAQGLTDVHLHVTRLRDDPAVVDRVHALGLLVAVGIVDDPDEAEAMAALGVDLLCTDDPSSTWQMPVISVDIEPDA